MRPAPPLATGPRLRAMAALAALVALAPPAAAPATVAGDYLQVDAPGILVVKSPSGQVFQDAAFAPACPVAVDCALRVALPAGIDASGTWRVNYQPFNAAPSAGIGSACAFEVPFFGLCVLWLPFPWASTGLPGARTLSLGIAGWTTSGSHDCPLGQPTAWLVNHDARTVHALCGVAP